MPETRTEPIVDLQVKLPESVLAQLNALAKERGKDRDGVIADLVQAAKLVTLSEALAPVHEDFRRSGMTEAELDELLKGELRAHREGA
jgi:hypothetical protein